MHERIAIDGKRLHIVQMALAVVVPGFGVENPFIAKEAQLGKAMEIAAFLLIAYIYMSLVVRAVRIVNAGPGVVIPAIAFVWFQAGAVLHFGSALV
jgi:hypothetical protein